ncbi:MAG: outer membrane lipoprotein chaperone LolA [Xanthomonadales bacterium]
MFRRATGINRGLAVGVVLLLALALQPAHASGLGARAQLEAFSSGLDRLAAAFSQTIVSRDGVVQDASEGQVWLARPNRFRWVYGGDFPEIVVADGEKIWMYDEALEQVTVRDQQAATVDSPLAVLMQPELLEREFEVREVGESDSLQLLELRARDAEAEFERLILGLRDGALELLIVEDAFGLRTEFRFRAIERNPELDPALFRFTPPAGVDVIGDLPGLSEAR